MPRNPGIPVVDFFSDFGVMLLSSDVNVRQAQKMGVQRPSLPPSEQISLFLCVSIDSHARARFKLVPTGYPPFCATSLFIALARRAERQMSLKTLCVTLAPLAPWGFEDLFKNVFLLVD